VPRARRIRVNRRAVTWLCGIVLVLLALIGIAQLLGITINTSPSMPTGVWQVAPVERPVAIGDIVVACLPKDVAIVGLQRGYIGRGACPSGVGPILKFVAATGGDTVTIDASGISVNGVRLPHSRTAKHDDRGRKLSSVAPGTYHLGEGQLWLWTPYSGSWDSRYFGVIAIQDVRSIARLLYQDAPPSFDFGATRRLLERLQLQAKTL
ncbi:MAG TPA: conjugative transfer signal peptidase TraF, partial [Candidatus Aquilonibacter sp.]